MWLSACWNMTTTVRNVWCIVILQGPVSISSPSVVGMYSSQQKSCSLNEPFEYFAVGRTDSFCVTSVGGVMEESLPTTHNLQENNSQGS